MATISMFFGIIISMICEAGCKHSKPHVHVWYQGHTASIDIRTGKILAKGKTGFPDRQAGWVKTWIEIHQEELAANWEIAIKGGEVYKIAPLQK